MRVVMIALTSLTLGGCATHPLQFACGKLLDGNIETYRATPIFANIQRDAGYDECDEPAAAKKYYYCRGTDATALANTKSSNVQLAPTSVVTAIARWRARQIGIADIDKGNAKPAPSVLMLSGGGEWGAFGAGFLNAWGKDDWAAVTGISTGALQGLFVAAGEYGKLKDAYNVSDGRTIARYKGYPGVIFKGTMNDTDPLRKMVLSYLSPEDPEQSLLLKMISRGADGQIDRPDLFIGMVEANSGDFKVVDVTKLVDRALDRGKRRARADLEPVAQCVAGVAMASSAVPIELRPVQIDGHTFFDGGARASVFDMRIGDDLTEDAKSNSGNPPNIYVIRNGPTVVFHAAPDPNEPDRAHVDTRFGPTRLGTQAYSTIVNQTEVMSIAGLRLNYPQGPISVVTADGFNSSKNPSPCGSRPDGAAFDATFMRCLVKWGEMTAKDPSKWIELPQIVPVKIVATSDTVSPLAPEEQ